MDIHADNDEERYEVGHDDVRVEPITTDVLDSHHTQEIPVGGFDIVDIVGDIDGNEDGADEDGNTAEEPTHETEEAEEGNRIETDLIEQLWFLGID